MLNIIWGIKNATIPEPPKKKTNQKTNKKNLQKTKNAKLDFDF